MISGSQVDNSTTDNSTNIFSAPENTVKKGSAVVLENGGVESINSRHTNNCGTCDFTENKYFIKQNILT